MENRRKFRLADVILSVICVVFVAEAAAPVASIGNSQYFWWLFMIAAFLLPYGLIASELGTAFPGDGGLYDWIQTAYPGTRWGARASWYYWINFPLWMASLAVVCPELLEVIFGGRIGPVWSLVIQLAFIWIVTWIAAYPVCDSILILNLSAAIKILLALTVGVLGIVYVSKNGFVNSMEARTFLPSFDLNSLSYISVILFNFLGFEVVCTYADNMQAPRRQIPQAIVTGGIVTVKDSSWLMSWTINRQPQFRTQPKDHCLVWVYSLFTDKPGDYIKKPMRECTGKEICMEWLYHIGVPEDQIEELATNSANTVPVMMPYIDAFFMPRAYGDRPNVVPEGSVNFAFLGQFAETPRDTIFTTEYSMRTGMEAVYTLLNVDRGVPEVWGSVYDVRDLLNATVKLRDGKKATDMDMGFMEKMAVKKALGKIEGTDIEKLLKEYGVI